MNTWPGGAVSEVEYRFLEADKLGALKLPLFALVDFGGTARFSLLGAPATFRVNVNNLFDTVYIAESNSNIHAAEEAPEVDLWNGIFRQKKQPLQRAVVALEPICGLEPQTYALRMRCSTI